MRKRLSHECAAASFVYVGNLRLFVEEACAQKNEL